MGQGPLDEQGAATTSTSSATNTIATPPCSSRPSRPGEIDIREENIARNWATAYDVPPVNDGRIVKAEIPHELPTGMQCFIFNTRRELFKDRRVREAIAGMFDFEWTNKNLFYGLYRATRRSSATPSSPPPACPRPPS